MSLHPLPARPPGASRRPSLPPGRPAGFTALGLRHAQRVLLARALGLALLLFAGGASAAAPAFNVRALWVAPDGFASAEAADRLVAQCRRAGLNTLLVDVMVHGTAYFKSSHFLGRVAANDSFDPLADVTKKAHAAGLQVQAWCCAYYEGTPKPPRPEWLCRSFDDQLYSQMFLSPANPDVNPYLLSVFADLLPYDIDGIHLDYIRYPGPAYDYSLPARRAFAAQAGFDPQDFLDHPERIVPADKEPFPIRVLHPKTHIERVWETTVIERTLDRAALGFAFISEEPAAIAALRAPGLLILSAYYDVPASIQTALAAYVERGGSLLWCNLAPGTLNQSPELQKLTGLSGAESRSPRRVTLQPVGEHPLAHLIPTNAFSSGPCSALRLQKATLIARLSSGEPALTLHQLGQGYVVVLGFNAFNLKSEMPARLSRGLVNWLRHQAGAEASDPLAAKRAQWGKWRAEQVTHLVRQVSRLAQTRHPKLLVSSSAGPSPGEYYACYRDARSWLTEGVNDCVFPMNYTEDLDEFADLLHEQAAAIPPGKLNRVYPGLQLYSTRQVNGRRQTGPIDPTIVERQLSFVQQLGHSGFCLFAYNSLSDEIIDVVRRFGR